MYLDVLFEPLCCSVCMKYTVLPADGKVHLVRIGPLVLQ